MDLLSLKNLAAIEDALALMRNAECGMRNAPDGPHPPATSPKVGDSDAGQTAPTLREHGSRRAESPSLPGTAEVPSTAAPKPPTAAILLPSRPGVVLPSHPGRDGDSALPVRCDELYRFPSAITPRPQPRPPHVPSTSTPFPSTTRRSMPCSGARGRSGVFQVESPGMRGLLGRLQPEVFRGPHRAGLALPAGAADGGNDPAVRGAAARARNRSPTRTRGWNRSCAAPTACCSTRSRCWRSRTRWRGSATERRTSCAAR